MTIKNAKCNKCGEVYDFLCDAWACSKSHDLEGQESIDVSYHQVEPIEYIEVSIELPKRGEDDNS